MNGRFGEESNTHTFLSTRRHSVVDYICVPRDVFSRCTNFRITACSDIVEQHRLMNLLGEKSKLPDHSILTFELIIKPQVTISNEFKETETKTRYNLRQIPTDFMNSNTAVDAINKLINKIETCETQNEVDKIYDLFCESVISEQFQNMIGQQRLEKN